MWYSGPHRRQFRAVLQQGLPNNNILKWTRSIKQQSIAKKNKCSHHWILLLTYFGLRSWNTVYFWYTLTIQHRNWEILFLMCLEKKNVIILKFVCGLKNTSILTWFFLLKEISFCDRAWMVNWEQNVFRILFSWLLMHSETNIDNTFYVNLSSVFCVERKLVLLKILYTFILFNISVSQEVCVYSHINKIFCGQANSRKSRNLRRYFFCSQTILWFLCSWNGKVVGHRK